MINTLRKMISPWTVYTILLAALLATPNSQAANESAQPSSNASQQEHLVILHINDTHGQLSSHMVNGHSVGGIARLAELVKQVRQENPGRVLLADAGDVFSRGDAVTSYYGGQANFDLMNRVGYDAMVLGNGDYYFGIDNLRQRIAEANFTILAGNIFQTVGKESKAVGQDFVVKKVGPLRIGLLGLSLISPDHASSGNLQTGPNLTLAKKWISQLQGQTDLVVLLSHQGLPADTMLGGLLGGVNIIIGGHTHTVLNEPLIIRRPGGSPDKTYIVQAGAFYEYLGRIDLKFASSDGQSWQVTEISSRLIPIDDTIAADAEIAKQLEEYRRNLAEVICQASEPIPARGPGENTVAHLALKAIGQEFPGCVILLDRGAIRAGINKGDVTRLDIARIHPWRNQLLKTSITAAQLRQALAEPGLLWSGCSFQRLGNEISNLQIAGVTVSDNQEVQLVLGELVLSKSKTLSNIKCQPTSKRVDALLEAYLRRLGQLAPQTQTINQPPSRQASLSP